MLTQGLINEITTAYGFEENLVSLDLVETLIEQKGIIDEVGFKNYSSNLEYTDFTKDRLNELASNISIELENNTVFLNLPEKEKNLLLISKSFQENTVALNQNVNNKFDPEWDTVSFLGGALSYQVIIGIGATATAGAFIVAGLVVVLVYNIIKWATK